MLKNIKIIGLGGCGINSINNMIDFDLKNVEFLVFDTDENGLKSSKVKNKILIGEEISQGLGSGANLDIGQKSAIESRNEIIDLLKNSDIIFIIAGIGGGTGGGAAPVISSFVKEIGAINISFVNMPFTFEGPKRSSNSKECLSKLKEFADIIIKMNNDNLLSLIDKNTDMTKAFTMVDKCFIRYMNFINENFDETNLNLDNLIKWTEKFFSMPVNEKMKAEILLSKSR